ALWHV
ncbi:putative phosphoglycerate transport regulatory PgtB domain protein, partial [Vibrio parahaemolyticus V-223/04]